MSLAHVVESCSRLKPAIRPQIESRGAWRPLLLSCSIGRRESGILILVGRSRASHDSALLQTPDSLVRRESPNLKADHASGQVVGHRSLQPDMTHLRQSLFALPIQFMNTRRNLRLPNSQMKPKSFRKSPAVLEVMKPPRRYPSGGWLPFIPLESP